MRHRPAPCQGPGAHTPRYRFALDVPPGPRYGSILCIEALTGGEGPQDHGGDSIWLLQHSSITLAVFSCPALSRCGGWVILASTPTKWLRGSSSTTRSWASKSL